MCVLWVCVYFDPLTPFSIPCSSSWRPLDSSQCPQFGKIPMADILHLYSTLQFPCPSAWGTDLYFRAGECSGSSTVPYWLDDHGQGNPALSTSSPNGGWGALATYILGVYELCSLTKWDNIDERLWKLWSAIPMYVIIIFLTVSCEIRMRSWFAVIPVYGSASVILMRMLECIQLSWHCQILCLSAYFYYYDLVSRRI